MSSSFVRRLIVVLVALTMVAWAAEGMSMDEYLAARRQKCGSDSDCVKVVGGTGQLLVDGLNFHTDTVSDVLEKLPGWFGPARPVDFLFEGQKVDPSKTLVKAGLLISSTLTMVSSASSSKVDL